MKKILTSFITVVLFLVVCFVLYTSGYCQDNVESASTDTAMTKAQAQEEEDLKELKNQIRREKFDLILPQVMRKHNIDMWIYVMRETLPDPFGEKDLGSSHGVFIFTDRGGDRIERAIIGRRWKRGWRGRRITDPKLVEECGAYDIIVEAIDRTEMPGGPKTELDYRLDGVGEFVAERDPKRIAVNYLEKLGPYVGGISYDGISHTDYIILAKALGDKYVKRLVSDEYLMNDYVSRPVKSELVLLKKIRKFIAELHERDLAKIVPGVTKYTDLGGPSENFGQGLRSVVDKNGTRIGNTSYLDPDLAMARKRSADYVLQRGDLICIRHGRQHYAHGGDLPGWKFGNFFEMYDEFAYILREGETEPPPEINKAWADVMKIHKILEDNIKIGRTAHKTYEILKLKLEEAGVIVNKDQEYFKDLDPQKPQVNLDLHPAAQGSPPAIQGPRIGTIGPDWQHEMTIPLYHHFYFEYFTWIPMPKWGKGKYLLFQMHDGVIVTERGVESLSPWSQEIRIIR